MKKSMLAVLVVLLLAAFFLSGNAQAAPGDVRSFILSNELGLEDHGGLIDKLIAAGHGSENLYQVLQFLAAQRGSGIPADFVAAVGSNPPGSEVFTAPFKYFAGLNGSVGINADGTLLWGIAGIYGRDYGSYDGYGGFVTTNATITGVAMVNYTLASDSSYFIDTRISRPPLQNYKAIGIAWATAGPVPVPVDVIRSFVLSNESPGHLIDELIATGYGDSNLYEALVALAPASSGVISGTFLDTLAACPAGSEIFTAKLSNYAGISTAIGINADGTLTLLNIKASDYYGQTGYATYPYPPNQPGVGPELFTYATSPQYYIDAGSSGTSSYKAYAIAWAVAAPTGSNVRLYFPHVDTSLPWQTEIALINTGAQPVTGTLKALSDAGQLVQTKAVTLSAHGRRQIAVADEFTNNTNIGYIIFDAASAKVQGYTKFYQTGKYRAAIPAVKEVNASDIYISHIDSGAEWWTGVSLVNTTSTTKALTITFNDGRRKNITLTANQHRAFTIRELFDNQPQPSIKSAVISNAGGVIGLELFGTNDGKQLEGIPVTDKTASTLYYPHVDSNGWWTGIVAYNPSSSGCTITITPYNAQGGPLSPINRNLTGKETYVGVVSQLGLPAQTAWLKMDATSPVTGFELFGTADGNQLAAYAGKGGAGAKTGIFAKIEKAGWTKIAVVNTAADAAAVTLTAYNDSGTPVATQALPLLGGHAKFVKLAEEIFIRDISHATYIAYSSDRNVVGFQLNGTSDDMMLDGLPALGGTN